MNAFAGSEKEQDCKVTVEPKTTGGINVYLNSRLKHMFGKQMAESAIKGAKEMGMKHCNIIINDYNSLDFVIKARTKTAIRKLREAK
ncbi:MAG: hypothetical protein ACOX4S_03145 [Anaerovoracaceae bacterium]|jgi:citrate lyase subunit gamma (acyl carrier protein)